MQCGKRCGSGNVIGVVGPQVRRDSLLEVWSSLEGQGMFLRGGTLEVAEERMEGRDSWPRRK